MRLGGGGGDHYSPATSDGHNFHTGASIDAPFAATRSSRHPLRFYHNIEESEVRLQRNGGRFGSPSCFPPGYDQRDGPLVSYRTRSGWPYNRPNELIGRKDRHASCAFV
ncbi:hypothetical protein PIB30_036925 [Stylosanthes scabra]|uniref:Uncharacterized protein n=1 Tax=Stylosanthes scabra TaxID=79078 RepID=A0ABU6SDD8_9FABA|nr:hypothetical protein [Stylosanthes scabra]